MVIITIASTDEQRLATYPERIKMIMEYNVQQAHVYRSCRLCNAPCMIPIVDDMLWGCLSCAVKSHWLVAR